MMGAGCIARRLLETRVKRVVGGAKVVPLGGEGGAEGGVGITKVFSHDDGKAGLKMPVDVARGEAL